MKRLAVLCLLLIMMLPGCAGMAPPSVPPDLTFANLQPVSLNVAAIDIRDNYTPPLQPPNVEHLFRITPSVAVEKLLRQQLAAMGPENTLRVLIDDASVVSEELPVSKGLDNFFTRQPAEKLKGKVLLHFELFSPRMPGIVIGHAEVLARRTKTLLENTSPAERDRAHFDLTASMMDDVNDGLRTIVKNTFGAPSF